MEESKNVPEVNTKIEPEIEVRDDKGKSEKDSSLSKEGEEVVSEDESDEELWLGSVAGRPVGMKNYGANCYVNAALQCLLSLPEMNCYFLESQYQKITYPTSVTNRRVCKDLTSFYRDIFKTKGSNPVVRPNSFVGMCPGGQQDAHEFFWKKLFPCIQDETNPAKKMKRNGGWDGRKSWKWYSMYNKSILDMLLGGQFEGQVVCKKCGYSSRVYDPFLGLSLAAVGDTLEDCLDAEFESADLGKDSGYMCEKCRKVTAITKSTHIDKPPKYFILHLKRLVGSAKKISKFIKYPMSLDITK